jgi:hypothetical protein
MFMPKKPVSVTLEESNLLWLRGRAAARHKRSLSDTIDEVLTEARRGGRGADAGRSVVGTIDLAADDPNLDKADRAIAALFDASLRTPFAVRERPPATALAHRRAKRPRRG